MPSDWIRFRQGAHENAIVRVSIEAGRVSAQTQPAGTILILPIEWERHYEWRDQGLRWELICCEAELLWKDAQYITSSLPAYAYNGNFPGSIKFPLSLTQVEDIETLRNGGDVVFDIRATVLMQLLADVNFPRQGIGSPDPSGSLHPFQVNQQVDIPKSRYEERLLPNMGLNGLASLTITFPPGTREIAPATLYELQQAERTLRTASTEEHFESVLSQCRNAIDALLNQFHLELPLRADGNRDASFNARVDALVGQYLKPPVISKSQADSIRKILKALWTACSAATKPGPPHHGRAFATFALAQAVSVVKLISEILWDRQRR